MFMYVVHWNIFMVNKRDLQKNIYILCHFSESVTYSYVYETCDYFKRALYCCNKHSHVLSRKAIALHQYNYGVEITTFTTVLVVSYSSGQLHLWTVTHM